MDLSIINKRSSRSLAISAVFFSFAGGFWIELGIDELVHAKLQYHWIAWFVFGPAFLAYGIFWAVQLARRASPINPTAPTSHN